MYRKFLIALVIILPLLAGSIFAMEKTDPKGSTNNQTQTKVKSLFPSRASATKPQTKLKFTPEMPQIDEDGEVEVEVFMDAFENKVTEVTLQIGYDPKVFEVESVKASDFLGGKEVTVNKIDKISGVITYGAKVDSRVTPPITGSDSLLEIEFKQINPTVSTSEVKFLPATYINAEKISSNALISTENTQVNLTQKTTR
jgi:hypothetical protein